MLVKRQCYTLPVASGITVRGRRNALGYQWRCPLITSGMQLCREKDVLVLQQDISFGIAHTPTSCWSGQTVTYALHLSQAGNSFSTCSFRVISSRPTPICQGRSIWSKSFFPSCKGWAQGSSPSWLVVSCCHGSERTWRPGTTQARREALTSHVTTLLPSAIPVSSLREWSHASKLACCGATCFSTICHSSPLTQDRPLWLTIRPSSNYIAPILLTELGQIKKNKEG